MILMFWIITNLSVMVITAMVIYAQGRLTGAALSSPAGQRESPPPWAVPRGSAVMLHQLDRAVALGELPPSAVVTAAVVAEALGISPRQVARLRIPFIDCGARSKRYLVADVIRWLDERRRGAA